MVANLGHDVPDRVLSLGRNGTRGEDQDLTENSLQLEKLDRSYGSLGEWCVGTNATLLPSATASLL